MNTVGIYKIENLINNKTYIGQSRNIKQRIYTHRYELNNNKHKNQVLQRAWDKYGKDNFKFEIIEECEIDNLNVLERKWIVYYDSYKDNNGYNLDFGGNANKEMSQETKDKISLNHSDINGENNPFYGKQHSEETKQKISNANKGRKMSKESIEINRLKHIGGKHSEETKLKMSISAKGKPHGIIKLTENNVTLIKTLISQGINISVIASEFNVTPQQISAIKSGRTWSRITIPEMTNKQLKELQASKTSGLKGENCKVSKLSNENVREIKVMINNGERTKDIAKKFNVRPNTISTIKSGRTWSHINIDSI